MRRLWVVLGMSLLFGLVAAQDGASVSVSDTSELGSFLTDAEGRTLYLFVDDAQAVGDLEPMSSGVRPEAAQCLDDCLVNWPPFLAQDGAVTIATDAEGQVDTELLYVADVDGRQQVVYNGWPLYYFAADTQPGDTAGQGVGDRWFVVSPEGEMIQGVAGGGAGMEGEQEDAMEEPAAPETPDTPAAPETPDTPDMETPETPGAPGDEEPGMDEPATPGMDEPTTPGEGEDDMDGAGPGGDTPANPAEDEAEESSAM